MMKKIKNCGPYRGPPSIDRFSANPQKFNSDPDQIAAPAVLHPTSLSSLLPPEKPGRQQPSSDSDAS
jgi:hypothetical protein